MNRYGENVFPCRTPATMSSTSVSPSGVQTFTFVLLYSIILAVTVSLGRPYASSIWPIFPLYMKSSALDKSQIRMSPKGFCTKSYHNSTDCPNLWSQPHRTRNWENNLKKTKCFSGEEPIYIYIYIYINIYIL